MWVCLAEAQETFMYPLQLLTGNALLAALMGMTTMAQLQAMEGIVTTPKATSQLATVGGELPLTAFPPTVSGRPAPLSRTKWWHPSSDQEATASRAEEEEVSGLDVSQEEHPHQRWKKAPCKTLQREPVGGLQKGLQTHPVYEVGIFPHVLHWLWPQGVPGPLPYFSGDGCHHWPHGFWNPQGPGGVDRMKGPPSH